MRRENFVLTAFTCLRKRPSQANSFAMTTPFQAIAKRAFLVPHTFEKAMSLSKLESENNKVPAQKTGIPHDFIPSTEEEILQCLADPCGEFAAASRTRS